MTILLCSNFSFAKENGSINNLLKGAITCEAYPIETVNSLVKKGSHFEKGYASTDFGKEMDYKIAIIVKEPLEIGNAKSYSVISDFGAAYSEFNGIVYSEFTGDYKKVVEQLKLLPVSNPKSEMNIGKFERKVPTVVLGEQNLLCPKTIALTPLENGKFLLGCGWCNGG